MSFSKEDIISALSHVNDPDLKKDLVTLNMIEDVRRNGNTVSFKVVLTTPSCPLKDQIKDDCINAIHERVSASAIVDIEFDLRVTTHRKDKGYVAT